MTSRTSSNSIPGPFPEEFVRELTRHQPRLRALIGCLLFDHKDIDDVCQNTNVVLLSKIADFQPNTDFWAWSSQIARYQVLAHAKRLGRDRLVFSGDLLTTLAVDMAERGTSIDCRREALDACLGKLSAPQRQLLELRYGTSNSISDIAVSLGRSPGVIRQTLYRIREGLLACISRHLAMDAAP